MTYLPFAIIVAAKRYDAEAVNIVFQHFRSYIAKRCLTTYKDEYGNLRTFIDSDLRYQAENALLSAIASFQIEKPPDNFTL